MPTVGCPHCNHLLAPEEVASGWCAECGKQIPEFALRKARGRRKPGTARKALAEQQRQLERSNVLNVRVTGILCFVGGFAMITVAGALALFMVGERSRPGELIVALGVGGVLVAAAGARMFVKGRVENDE